MTYICFASHSVWIWMVLGLWTPSLPEDEPGRMSSNKSILLYSFWPGLTVIYSIINLSIKNFKIFTHAAQFVVAMCYHPVNKHFYTKDECCVMCEKPTYLFLATDSVFLTFLTFATHPTNQGIDCSHTISSEECSQNCVAFNVNINVDIFRTFALFLCVTLYV